MCIITDVERMEGKGRSRRDFLGWYIEAPGFSVDFLMHGQAGGKGGGGLFVALFNALRNRGGEEDELEGVAPVGGRARTRRRNTEGIDGDSGKSLRCTIRAKKKGKKRAVILG